MLFLLLLQLIFCLVIALMLRRTGPCFPKRRIGVRTLANSTAASQTTLATPRLGIAVTVLRKRSPAQSAEHALEVLVVRRAKAPHKGRWSLPGGSVELGETLAAAAAREIREECGIAIDVGRPFFATDAIFRRDGSATNGGSSNVDYHFGLVHILACASHDAPIVAASDVDAVQWARIDSEPSSSSAAAKGLRASNVRTLCDLGTFEDVMEVAATAAQIMRSPLAKQWLPAWFS